MGQLLTELCESLVREHGCRVSVVAGHPLIHADGHRYVPSYGFVDRELHSGIEILRSRGTTFSRSSFAGRASNYLSYFLTASIAGLRFRRPDVVVALTDPPIIGLAAAFAARRSGAKFVMLYQDIFPEVACLLEDFHSEAVNRLLERVNRFLLRKADRVVALGETMKERLVKGKGADPQKVTVIHNWADCAAILPQPKENSFSLMVMHSGNMGLPQGLDNVVEMASRLKPYPHIQIVFVGEGVTRPHLENRARSLRLDNVLFLPYQPKERLSESFASADVFLVSLKRGLAGYIVPSKLYGILAAGRPYVAAVESATEVAAITKKYDCGLLAEPEDPDDLAEKVLTLYRDPVLCRRLALNARKAAFHFDRPRQVGAYYNLFRELAEVRSET
ncbi:MAG: glycosyltransferase family 4 protein [Deltaproteobacteria bacterium]|nr:glycosyltransferase family 4 protein [Deltaproteobacteria bacterium]